MKIHKPRRSRWMAPVSIVLGCVMAFGCMNLGRPGETMAAQKSGAELWANNCRRCHNFRSPASYNDVQWDIVMMHMRVRANLTAEEHKTILEFLQAGN